MNRSRLIALALTCLLGAGVFALAQTDTQSTAPPDNSTDTGTDNSQAQAPDATAAPQPEPSAPAEDGTSVAPVAPAPGQRAAAPPSIPTGPPPTPTNAVLVLTGLDKITGRPTRLVARLNQPVQFATLTITARYCYSTPPSETPETSAFVQIDDHRPDQPERRVFSGWMYASSPGLSAMEHPLYDVWVISCSANAPGQTPPTVASAAPVKVRSPDATDSEGVAPLPEGAGQ
jgi:hypothetical protein